MERRRDALGRFLPTPLPERFWGKVDRRGQDECWVWLGARDRKGYGEFYNGHRMVHAHRIAWELAHGPIEAGLYSLHRCDNPPCCNPAHLFVGTPADNTRDMLEKERGVRGSNHPNAKLTEKEVVEIRRRHAAGNVTQGELAAEFGVNQSAISRAVCFRRWKHTITEDA